MQATKMKSVNKIKKFCSSRIIEDTFLVLKYSVQILQNITLKILTYRPT